MKELIHKAFRALGYDIHRRTVGAQDERNDPFLRQKALLGAVRGPLVIFDVGAHVGSITGVYRSLFPNATIYAFEPFPESFRKLQTSFASDRFIRPYQLGFADKSGTASFNVNEDKMTNSLLMTETAAVSFWGGVVQTIGEIEVDVTTVDEFCDKNDIDHVHILKVDTQGAEKRVFEGSDRMLREKRISCIYTEMLVVPTYARQGKFHEILEVLDSRGYSLFSMYNFDFRPGTNRLLQVDAVFFHDHCAAK
jgi:FkbM family methyltransferase